jgi:hypothetical protein
MVSAGSKSALLGMTAMWLPGYTLLEYLGPGRSKSFSVDSSFVTRSHKGI